MTKGSAEMLAPLFDNILNDATYTLFLDEPSGKAERLPPCVICFSINSEVPYGLLWNFVTVNLPLKWQDVLVVQLPHHFPVIIDILWSFLSTKPIVLACQQ